MKQIFSHLFSFEPICGILINNITGTRVNSAVLNQPIPFKHVGVIFQPSLACEVVYAIWTIVAVSLSSPAFPVFVFRFFLLLLVSIISIRDVAFKQTKLCGNKRGGILTKSEKFISGIQEK